MWVAPTLLSLYPQTRVGVWVAPTLLSLYPDKSRSVGRPDSAKPVPPDKSRSVGSADSASYNKALLDSISLYNGSTWFYLALLGSVSRSHETISRSHEPKSKDSLQLVAYHYFYY